MAKKTNGLNSKECEKVERWALEVIIDYELFDFPIDVFAFAKNCLDATIIPYSKVSPQKMQQLYEKFADKDSIERGITIWDINNDGMVYPTIFYNDLDTAAGMQKYTIAHEIKHIIFREFNPTEKQEDEAEYFGEVFLAPKVIVITEKLKTPEDIMNRTGLSYTAALNLLQGINKRRYVYGEEWLEEYEKDFLKERGKF